MSVIAVESRAVAGRDQDHGRDKVTLAMKIQPKQFLWWNCSVSCVVAHKSTHVTNKIELNIDAHANASI